MFSELLITLKSFAKKNKSLLGSFVNMHPGRGHDTQYNDTQHNDIQYNNQ